MVSGGNMEHAFMKSLVLETINVPEVHTSDGGVCVHGWHTRGGKPRK